MIQRPFGTTGTMVSVIGQGTWHVHDPASAGRALEVGLGLGMTHIDTAELYQNQSKSEEMIGRVLKPRSAERSQWFLASKVLPNHASYKGTIEACEASLARMGTDYLDLYYLHWWSDDHPLEETMRAMAELVDAKKVRHIGVSNFDVHELEAAKRAVGTKRIAANQVLYHLVERGIESEIVPWCRKNGIAVVGYSPFGAGHFPAPTSAGGKVLARLASQIGKTPRQLALAFLTRDPAVFVIPKAEKEEHARENAGGAFELPKDAVEAIDQAFPMKPGLRFL
ncbi:MAG: aldo/keto reductase [Thermoplasmatota archaeon]